MINIKNSCLWFMLCTSIAAPEGDKTQMITITGLNGDKLQMMVPEGSSVAEVKSRIPQYTGPYHLIRATEKLNDSDILPTGDLELTLVKITMYISSHICGNLYDGYYRILIPAAGGVYSLNLLIENFNGIKYPGITTRTPPNSLEFKIDAVEKWQFHLEGHKYIPNFDKRDIRASQNQREALMQLYEEYGDNLSMEIIAAEEWDADIMPAWLFRPNEAPDLVARLSRPKCQNYFSKAIGFGDLIIKALCKLHKNGFEAELPFSVLFSPIISLIMSSTGPIPTTEFIDAVDLAIQNYVATILEGPKT